jgi:hypothetical protein
MAAFAAFRQVVENSKAGAVVDAGPRFKLLSRQRPTASKPPGFVATSSIAQKLL